MHKLVKNNTQQILTVNESHPRTEGENMNKQPCWTWISGRRCISRNQEENYLDMGKVNAKGGSCQEVDGLHLIPRNRDWFILRLTKLHLPNPTRPSTCGMCATACFCYAHIVAILICVAEQKKSLNDKHYLSGKRVVPLLAARVRYSHLTFSSSHWTVVKKPIVPGNCIGEMVNFVNFLTVI